MREFSVPATVRVADDETLVDAVYENAAENGSAVAYRRRGADRQWQDVTAAQFAAEVTAVARGLVAAGVQAGDRVALLSHTRYEWTLVDYAILAVGAVTVPVYETSSAEQIRWIVGDSGAVAVVVESDKHTALVDSVRADLDEVVNVWRIEHAAGEPGAVEQLVALGGNVSEDEVHARRKAIRADDLATLIYTSGTTGRPKGCELTHRNMQSEVRSVADVFPELLTAGGSVLLFLPLAHVFGADHRDAGLTWRPGSMVGHTARTWRTCCPTSPSFRPSFVLAVPRVFEKVYNGSGEQGASHDSGRGKIFARRRRGHADQPIARRSIPPRGPAWRLRAEPRPVRPARVQQAARRPGRPGAALAMSAAGRRSPPGSDTSSAGPAFTVLEGYGLTESSAGVTVNALGAQRIGTVGRPVPGQSVRIADDGEILVSGPVVFRGYWKNETATKEAVTDGWFHTGDIGELDDAGYLKITGRKKELIVTAGGKNVAPAVLEDRLRAHALISQCMVVGDGKPFIGVLVTIDVDALPGWLERAGKSGDTPLADLVDDPDLRREVSAAVDDANLAVSRAEQIREFRILPVDFSEAGGEMTPTMKVKRKVVAERYAADIASIYAGRKKQPV